MAQTKKADVVERVPLIARVPRTLKKRVERHGVDQDLDIQEIVVEALEEYLKKRGA
jgi:hypothetical protein